jgi:hypothetical protein
MSTLPEVLDSCSKPGEHIIKPGEPLAEGVNGLVWGPHGCSILAAPNRRLVQANLAGANLAGAGGGEGGETSAQTETVQTEIAQTEIVQTEIVQTEIVRFNMLHTESVMAGVPSLLLLHGARELWLLGPQHEQV